MSRLSEDLRRRRKLSASQVIHLCIALPKQEEEIKVLGRQLLRPGTSVTAHAREASRARSDAGFCSKLDGLLQEADESQLWLELPGEDCGITDAAISRLHQESDELLAIFTTMVSQIRRRGPWVFPISVCNLSTSMVSAFQLFDCRFLPLPSP